MARVTHTGFSIAGAALVSLVLWGGFFAYAPAAQATVGAACSEESDDLCDAATEYCSLAGTTKNTCVPNTSEQLQKDLKAAEADKAAAKIPTPYGAQTAEDKAYGSIMARIMSLFAWLVGVAALTLQHAVYYTVVTMGDYVNNLSAIGVAWRILRDIGNIILIFGFLLIGIATIIENDIYGWGKKALPNLLMAAVFINFSLFAAQAVIDVGNLFATQFYTQINGGKLPTPVTQDFLRAIENEGISNKIMAQVGLTDIYGGAARNPEVFKAANSWITGFMGIILFIITAFVMFSLAFILIARFVILIFLMILAPIGFAGLAMPKLASSAGKWWSELFSQTITAPVLLLLLYIALAVITDSSFLTGFGVDKSGPQWLGYINNGNMIGFASTMLSFIVAMGLLLAVVILAKRMSVFGGEFATKTAGKLTFGATAWGLSRTAGRASYFGGRYLRQKTWFNKADAWTGRAVSRTLDKGANSTFDVRGSKAFGFAKIDAGKPAEGGFAGARTRNIKDHESEAKRIEEAHKEAFKERAGERENIDAKKSTLATVQSQKKRLESEKDAAERAKAAAEAQEKARKEELEKLEAEEQRRKQFNIQSTPEELSKLAEARKREEESQKALAAASKNLEEVTKKFDQATDGEKKAKAELDEAEKVPGKRMGDAIKASKTAYAEGINQPLNPVGWFVYGPDTARAARKIKDSLKEKSKKDKLKDLVKDIEKEDAEAEGKDEDGKANGKSEDKKEEKH